MRRNRNLKSKILTILRDIPATRDSDILLMHEVWKKYYPEKVKKTSTGDFGIYFKDMFNIPREDDCKRIRALIQNEDGKFLPTSWAVAKQRKINEEEWREYLKTHTQEQLL